MDYVRQGGRLGFISDLYDAQGVEVPFFGYPAKSMPIAAMIARRGNMKMAPMAPVKVIRLNLMDPAQRMRF